MMIRSHTASSALGLIRIVFAAIFLLLFVHAYMAFANRGAFGYEAGHTRGWILIASNILMLATICFYSAQLRSPSTLLKLLFFWIFWLPLTCLLLLPDGLFASIKGLMEVLYCPLFFIVFYVFTTKQPVLRQKMVSIFMVLLAFVSLLFSFVFVYQNSHLRGSLLYAQLNDAYYVLLLLPWVLLCKKPLFRNLGIFLVAGIVFWSLKRTALIALVAALAVYLLAECFCSRKKMQLRWVITSFIVILGVLLMFYEFEKKTAGTFSTRIASVSEDSGSGRLDIYASVIDAQWRSSALGWAFGHGHNGVRRERVHATGGGWDGIRTLSAHNDWLEVLFDYGLPGLAMYSMFHITLVWVTFELLRKRSRYGPPMAASYVLFFTMSMTSHLVLYPTYFSYLMAFWGMVSAVQRQEKAHARAAATAKRMPYAFSKAY
jgi:O-antigen ligase